MKTKLDTELNLIQHTAVRDLTRAVLDAAPTCFWTMPASTSGKYHPAISLGEGGLVRHTKAVVRLTCHLLDMAGVPLEDVRHSYALSAAILHDVCKKRDDELWTAFDHPLRAANLIRSTHAAMSTDMDHPYILRETEVATIANIVACHMGRWNTNPHSLTDGTLPLPTSALQRLVHTADCLASRKDITITGIA